VTRHLAVAAALIAALVIPAHAQDPTDVRTLSAQKPAGPSSATLKVQVVLSRYQGDKKISSLPYTLTVNTNESRANTGNANLRIGTQVPITTMARQGSDKDAQLVPTVNYRDVGTNMDCTVTALDDGRFRVNLTVDDSSIDTSTGTQASGHPAFRSFRAADTMLLRDGATAQFSSATDKVSGDVWKVDVTLTVVK
jgi:type II secretory pathway component GspD/PulD (secretin)